MNVAVCFPSRPLCRNEPTFEESKSTILQQLSRRALIRAWAIAAFIATAAFGAAATAGAPSSLAGTESEPTLEISDFRGLPPVTGVGYRVEPIVPISGYQGQFTLHTDAGDLHADGSGLLRQRIAEVGPTMELQKLSKSDVFVSAMSKSAQSGVQAIGRAVTSPVDTAKALPAGIGRFFKSVGQTAQNIVTSSGEGDASGAAKDALGINQAKRTLAKKVGVDPYTTNPYLSARLDQLARAAFAGGVSLDVVMAVSTAGAATVISATKTVSNLAWDLPPADVREKNSKELAALGVDEATRTRLLDNRIYTPTMALSFVESMKQLGVRDGTNAFTAIAAGAQTEPEARFFIAQLRLANLYAKDDSAIVAIVPLRRIGAFRTAQGKLFMPLALDYLSWTNDIKVSVEAMAPQPRGRVVWLTGQASPKAAAQLRTRGWTVRDNVSAD